MNWLPEHIAMARKLSAEGYSCAQIAGMLGIPGLSRSAVIGKLHRFGVKRAMPQRARKTKPAGGRRKAVAKPLVATQPPKKPQRNGSSFRWGKGNEDYTPKPPRVMAADPVIAGKTIIDLGFAECRFPTGVNEEGTQIFCAAPTATPSESWCACHREIVWAPSTLRRALDRKLGVRA
jgi:GcrA cell cycle regulator